MTNGGWLTLKVPAGIGDFSWIWSKLHATPKVRWQVAREQPQRTAPFLAALGVKRSRVCYGPFCGADVVRGDVVTANGIVDIEEVRGMPPVDVSVNAHLEAGRALADWLPAMQTTYHYDVPLPNARYRDRIAGATCFVSHVFGLYTSSYKSNAAWEFWSAEDWRDLALSLLDTYPDSRFVLIGADYDYDLSSTVLKLLEAENVDVLDTVGLLPIGATVHLLRHLSHLFAFPSGIGVLGSVVECPTTMFMPPHLWKMVGTFHPRSDAFRNTLFEPVAATVEWIEAHPESVRNAPGRP